MKLEYFTAKWCQPCKWFGPTIEKVVAEYDIDMEKIDIDEHPERIPADVLGVPTVILYLEGASVARFSGAKREEDLVEWLALSSAKG